MSIYSYKQRNTIVLAILILLGCFVIYSLRTIAGSVLSTIVLYTILRPVFIHLTEKWMLKRWLAALLIIVISLVLIVVPFLTLSFLVIGKISEFNKDPMRIKVIIQKIDDFAGSKFNQPDLVDKGIQKSSEIATELFPSVLGGAASIFLGLVVMYFLLYFMFVQRETFEGGLLKYAPFREQNALKFATELRNTTYSNVLGQGFIAVVQGALVSLAFFIFGINDAIFWGVISTFLSFLPVVGAPLIFIPAALIELANGNNTAGWGILLFGFIIITNIDNVIRLLIAKKVSDTHPIITVVGVIIGIPIFGIMGLVFGPLLLSYFILTIRIYETSKLASERLERIKLEEDE
ncbi:AI-2E family transporter [Daejeonella oryzae]|uniref:AI-2E family transporter n=1 Tax=Daejeonella oryzae TaxID=1122943 RepID=UPI00040E8D3D|nr:AI-2E family transporter [Daejeonella oryzae]